MLQTAGGVTLEWDPSPDAWVAGYAIHYGTASGNYTVRVDVGNRTSVTLSNLAPGVTYYFVATAYAADGQESLPSNEVAYTVPGGASGGPANTAPVVNAGPDQTITLPASATLTATVADDGLPATPGTVSMQWEVVTGPGEVAFTDPTAATTSAAFEAA
ncbi:MAG TPA: fibronectin type III domain-containing protein, partial [Verrucomicrobiae bacterium]